MGNIKVKMQRVAVINDNRVVSRAVRYSTVKADEMVSYAANISHIPMNALGTYGHIFYVILFICLKKQLSLRP